MRCQDTTDPGTVRVPLYARDGAIRAYTLIDADDAGFLGAARWRFVSPGYAARWEKIRGTTAVILLHRVILGAPNGVEVDHINRDGLDNRRCNLRLILHAGNMQNRPS